MQTDSHVLMLSGKSFADKLKDLREQLEEKKASAMIVSMLDEIAWLFNLRAGDIPYNPGRRKARQSNHAPHTTWRSPVFFAYAAVTLENATLFINNKQVGEHVRTHLGELVEIRPYDEVFSYLDNLKASLASLKHKVVKYIVSIRCVC